MPTYRMTAPNGQTYSVDGPTGASDDDVRSEILRQHPDAGSAAPKETFLAKAGRIGDAEDQAGTTAYRAAMQTIHDKGASGQPLGIGDILAPVSAAARYAMAPVKGLADATFGDKPVALPFGINSKGMTGGDIATAVIPAAGGMVEPALAAARSVADAAAPAANTVGDAVSSIPSALKNLTQAGRRAQAASDTMRAEAAANASTGQATADAQASADADKAARATSLSARAKARQAVLASRQADAASTATPPVLDVGAPAHLSDIGDQVRTPALAAQSGIEAKMQAADTQYRSAMDAVAADRASSGVGVSDMPTAKALIAKSEALVNPDPVTAPDVGTNLSASAGGKLHTDLLEALKPKIIPLSADEAQQATAAGVTVQKNPDGTLYRTIKPDMATVDNFRRLLGKLRSGPVEGYGAINSHEANSMYKDVSSVLDEYVGGAQAPVQANWAAGKRALAPFERVRAGQNLVGTQKGTDIAAVPAANIPRRIMAGGRDTIGQASTVAGRAPVQAAMRSMVQNGLSGVTGSDAIAAKVAPGTNLGEVVNSDDALSAAVKDYIAKTQAAEASGAQATDLGQRAATSASRAQRLSDIADTLQGTSQKAAAVSSDFARQLANLEIADPQSVGSMYSSMLDKAHQAGSIDIGQYSAGKQLAASAQKDFALKSSRDKWLRSAAGVLGIGALGREGYSLMTQH